MFKTCATKSRLFCGTLFRSFSSTTPVVNSYTEWDPLEEVLVGRVEGACVPAWDPPMKGFVPADAEAEFRKMAGKPFPEEMVKQASRQVDEYCKILELEGAKVVRPEPYDSATSFKTPNFACEVGYTSSVPRDIFIVLGDTILEATMGMRSRFFDYVPFRRLMKSYFDRGSKWIAAPKPLMDEDNWHSDKDFNVNPDEQRKFQLKNNEVVFEAAAFQRLGKDVLVQRSNICNELGIEWVRRHFPQFQFHQLDLANCRLHLDSAVVPLAPGKLLINPRRPGLTGDFAHWFTYKDQELPYYLPKIFKGWDILVADCPPAVRGDKNFLFTPSDLCIANVLSLDEKRVIVEASETRWQHMLRQWGFTPIPVYFDKAMYFGGAFHCFTVDIRRRGTLQSYTI